MTKHQQFAGGALKEYVRNTPERMASLRLPEISWQERPGIASGTDNSADS